VVVAVENNELGRVVFGAKALAEATMAATEIKRKTVIVEEFEMSQRTIMKQSNKRTQQWNHLQSI
jgi:hypothetical protein